MIYKEHIQDLILKSRDDIEILKLIEDCLLSFCEYHSRIYRMETWLNLYSYDNMDRGDYQQESMALDRSRTMAHNSLISNLKILNRLAEQNNIPPVYGGIVSEDRPYRVEIADAVLVYVEEIVSNRNK